MSNSESNSTKNIISLFISDSEIIFSQIDLLNKIKENIGLVINDIKDNQDYSIKKFYEIQTAINRAKSCARRIVKLQGDDND